MRKYFKSLLLTVIAAVVFVPAVKADVQEISEVNVTIAAPVAGQEIKKIAKTCHSEYTNEDYDCSYPSIYPTVTFGEETYHIGDGGKAFYISSYPSEAPAENPYAYDEIPEVTFTEGEDYVVEVYLVPNEGYVFAENVTLKVNDSTTNYELSDWNGPAQLMFYAKVTAKAGGNNSSNSTTTTTTPATTTTTTPATTTTTTTETTETTTYKVLDGDKQTYKTSSDENLTFRFNIEYAEFKESGKVYVDDELVDPENYSTKEGSTYVIFTKAYTKKLDAGEHTMKVTTANGEATTSFTIEAAEVASSKKATTSNPQTGDNVILYVSTLLISLIGFALVNVKRKLFN